MIARGLLRRLKEEVLAGPGDSRKEGGEEAGGKVRWEPVWPFQEPGSEAVSMRIALDVQHRSS